MLGWDLVPLAFLPCVGTLAAVVLRFGLFDIKAVARRAFVYGALTVVVVVTYAGIVLAAGALVTTGPVLAPSLLATVVVAIAVQPLKDRVQRSVSRLLYGTRDDPYATLAKLGEQLENIAAGPDVLDTIVDTVAKALRVPYVATELYAADGTLLRRAERGVGGRGQCVELPAVAGGLAVGKLTVMPRGDETEFAASELRLLTDLARQSASALRAVQLTVELQVSRNRVVLAGAEERRRVQRDLHDGVGPSLAGLRMQVGAARAQLARGSRRAVAATLVEIERQVVDCTADVRHLLLALRSPLLDSLGLVGALRHQAQVLGTHADVALTVDLPASLPSMPAAVEEAILAIASEAMTNIVRHAHASRCVVTVTADTKVVLAVTDDGQGVTTPSRVGSGSGIGMSAMRQRATEIGGSCEVTSTAAGGTVVRATFPLIAAS